MGYSLKISELKASVGESLLAKANEENYPRNVGLLREQLEGERISYSSRVTPWWSVNELVGDLKSEPRSSLLWEDGYPLLFVAPGYLIQSISHHPSSNQKQLEDLLQPEELYLVEAWDQS